MVEDDTHKKCPCPTCGMVNRASDCGVYDRWKKGVFGNKGSGCLALDLHRIYLYQHEKQGRK